MADNVGQSSPTAENAPVTDPAHAPTTANGEVTPQSSQSPQGSPQTQPAPAGRQASFWTQLKSALGTPHHEKHRSADPVHESLETIVFVVFLVVLLKAFVAEAFVIPTGSMATTLLGYNRQATCDKCGWSFPVNASDETELGHRRSGPITKAMCPHCAHIVDLKPNGGPDGGDKVLVFKPAYDIAWPHRFDVFVFKYPGDPSNPSRRGPQEDFVAKNYIKRLWGLPGDKLSICYGDVFLRTEVDGKTVLQMLRKPPAQQLEMRRIVYHNDYQRSDLKGIVPPRWADEDQQQAWQASADGKEFSVAPGERMSWLRYRHFYHSLTDELLAKLQDLQARRTTERNPAPNLEEDIKQITQQLTAARLITDTVGYNTYKADDQFGGWAPQSWNWVRDLMIECDVTVEQPTGSLTLQLVSGVDQHQAVFDLASGDCTLRVLRDGKTVIEQKAATTLKKAGRFHLRFGNFDERLTLWVDGRRPFGDGLEFPGQIEEQRGPCVADLRPASIGAQNAAVRIQHLQLWRDIYYTRETSSHGLSELTDVMNDAKIALTDEELKQFKSPSEVPTKWQAYHGHRPRDYDVKPGEYFALGDNSTFSSDSRDWGGVPERLLLGKAVFVYWPILRFGPIW